MRSDVILHGYFRSTASYRVRIALKLKGIGYTDACHHLRRNEQNSPAYRALKRQGLLPTLEAPGGVLTQSLAICEYLDETYRTPPLLPAEPFERARVRAFTQVIACDVHPVQNLKILARLRALGIDQQGVDDWARTTIAEGLQACAALIEDRRTIIVSAMRRDSPIFAWSRS
jgi:maleylpyruvate isomerase